jgi:BirA family biotin operon repressor/biotin-[acetyl-CoA-carboxylase] ligase
LSTDSAIDWPKGYDRVRYQELDSTNAHARRLAEKGAPGPVWISAARQTAGRGRRGQAWNSTEGDLAVTLLMRPQIPPAVIGQLSFVAALASAETASHFAPAAAITVKWPNDILAEGRKLAGILLEGGKDTIGSWLAIGIGMNLVNFPQGTEFPATCLVQLGVTPPTTQHALTVLASRFAHWYDGWMKDGFALVRTAWLARASGLGLPIRARLAGQEVHTGVFEGIDESGALLLNQETGVRSIAAAEVFF